MKFNLILLIIFLFLVIVFYSCTDEPSSLGIELVGSQNISAKIYDTAIDTTEQTSSSLKRVIPLGGANWILVGKYQDIKASALMKFIFGLADSLKNDLNDDKINVLDSWIILQPRYIYVDSMAAMDFTVHKVNSYWSPTAFTIDSLSKLVYEPTNVGSQFINTDTLYTFHIDSALPLAWLKNTADKNLESNFGIYLNPSLSSNKVVGFEAFTSISTAAAKLFVVIEKPGVYIDTLNGFIAADISLIDAPEPPSTPAGLIYAQSSVALNSRLEFNLDSVPSGIVINKAEIFISIDSDASIKGSSYNNSLRLSYLKYSDSLNTEGNLVSLSFKDNKFTGDITVFVRTWISRKENFGMLIETGSPFSGLERFALKGSDYFDYSERPRLKITYTRK